MTPPAGVYLAVAPDQWKWSCGRCGAESSEAASREVAREQYKQHRTGGCTSRPAAPSPTPQEDSVKQEESNAGSEAEAPSNATATGPAPMASSNVAAAVKPGIAKKKAAPKAEKPAAKAKAEKAPKAKKGGRVFRIGFVTNPKTKREVYPSVSATGALRPGAAKRLGITQAPKWGRIEAKSRGEARKQLKAGAGEFFTPSKGEK